MKTGKYVSLVLALGLALGLLWVTGVIRAGAPPAQPEAEAPVDATFTYQGQLMHDGAPVTANCLMAFRLFDGETGCCQVGGALTRTVPVSDGLFTEALNFGPNFEGHARWLEVAVECPGDVAFTTLPRQQLTAAPYSLYALSTGALQGNPVTTTAPINGEVLEWDGSVWAPAEDDDTTYTAGNQLALNSGAFAVIEGPGSDLNADMVDGLHASGLGRVTRYFIPGGGGTVTVTFPHYNTFQISIGEAYGSPQKVGWITAIENDYRIAWIGIDSTGSIVTGNAQLSSTNTILTLGSDIELRCPGANAYELVVTSTYEDVRLFLLW
ncbi:MAG: hypothetical protein JXB35_07285 [Anaerolineae bacterium]|nr:hypothetical protein [Anaerolineae bacterium]